MNPRPENRPHRLWQLATRLVLSLAITAALLAAAPGLGSTPVGASLQDEQRFVQLANDLRASRGVPPLSVHPELTAGARFWTAHMADLDQLAHSPDMSAGVTVQWTVLGENVGMHGIPDVDQLFQAFVNSPAHYQNLVDARFNYIGVGVVSTSEGKLWTTHRFMSAPATGPPPTAAPAPTTSTTMPTTVPDTAAPTAPPVPPVTEPPAAPPTTAGPTTVPTTAAPAPPATEPHIPILPTPTTEAPPATLPATPAPGTTEPANEPVGIEPATSVDDPNAGPAAPDVPTVEQVLVELVEAGI